MVTPRAARRGAGGPGAAEYRPSGFFALRTPFLPARSLFEVVGEPGPRPDDAGELARALERDRAATVERLRAAVATPEVREAIFVASPSLAGALEGMATLGAEAARKVDQAAYRYFARMSARSTPFGLFAGSSSGEIGDRTALALAPRASYRRHVRPDMFALCSLVEALVADPATRAALRYVKNPSLYPAGGRLRYSQLSLVGEEGFPLVDVEPTEHLALALAAAEGPASAGELVAALRAAYPGVGEGEAGEFVDALIDNGLLVPALVPTVTGPEPTGPFLEELGRAPGLAAARAAVAAAQSALGLAAEAPLGEGAPHYREAVAALGSARAPVDPQKAYQVDLVKPLERGTLGRGAVVDELLRAAALLRARARPKAPWVVARLLERFVARYGEREVPLAEALDDDVGVGFEGSPEDATPLLETLELRAKGDEGGEGGDRAPAPEARLRDLLHRALARGDAAIEVEPDFFGEAAPGAGPDAFAVFATLVAPSGPAADAGEFELWWPRVVAPSGVALLARFCHADPALEARVRAHLALEDELAGGALLADVVHLSNGRLGNIVLRPSLRPYEVVCNGRSGAPRARQLPASDLLVSARGGRFFVRSRSLGRRVVPRITNAHNVPRDATANVYRFLYAMQSEGLGAGVWDWSSLAESERLPRVRSGRTVFAPATWSLGRERLRAFVAASGARQYAALRALREELALPRWVSVGKADNLLALDLENPLCIETFAHLAKDQERVRVLEAEPASGLVRGPEGAFAHELVVPFVRATPAPAAAASPRRTEAGRVVLADGAATADAPRCVAAGGVAAGGDALVGGAAGEGAPFEDVVAPGGEVLYAKLYGGPSCFDALVRDVIVPVVRGAGAAVRRWFFVRYRDPEHHLRVRLFGDRARLWAEVLPALSDAARPLLASRRVYRLQIDSYDRETERYGGPAGVRLAERLFHADSEACAEILDAIEDEDQRWRAVALGVDALLRDFGLDLGARYEFARRAAEGFGAEFGLEGPGGRRALDAKVRELGGAAEALVRGEGEALAEVRAALERRSRANEPVVAALREARARGELGADEPTLLWSYVHMHANRLFSASPRAQELVLHSLLARAYRAALARAGAPPAPRGAGPKGAP